MDKLLLGMFMALTVMMVTPVFAQEDDSEPPSYKRACFEQELPLSHHLTAGVVGMWCLSNQGFWLETKDPVPEDAVLTVHVPYTVLPIITKDNFFEYSIFLEGQEFLTIDNSVTHQYYLYQTLEFNLFEGTNYLSVDYGYPVDVPSTEHDRNLKISFLEIEGSIPTRGINLDDVVIDDVEDDDQFSRDDVFDDGTVMGDEIFDDETFDDMMFDDDFGDADFRTDEERTDELIDDITMMDDAKAENSETDDAMVDDTMVDDAMVDDAMVDDAMVDDAMVDDAMVDDAMVDDTMVDDTMVDEMMNGENMDGTMETVKPDAIMAKTDMDILGTMSSWEFCGADSVKLDHTLTSGTLSEICSVRLATSFELTATMDGVKEGDVFTMDVPYGLMPLVSTENVEDYAKFINLNFVLGETIEHNLTHQYLDYQTFEFTLKEDTHQVKILYALLPGSDGPDHEYNMANSLREIESDDGQASMTFMEEELESMRDGTMGDEMNMMGDVEKPKVSSGDIEWAKGTPQEELLQLMGEPKEGSMMGLISITQDTLAESGPIECTDGEVMLANESKSKSLCVDPISVNELIGLGYGYIDVFIKDCDATQVPLAYPAIAPNSERTKTICVFPESLATLMERGFEPIGEFIEPE